MANIPLQGMILERVVSMKLQVVVEETGYLDPFQSGLRLVWDGYDLESP